MRKRPAFIFALTLLALWPVLRWYAQRLNDGAESRWGLLALATLAVLAWLRRREAAKELPLTAPSLLLLLYALSFPFAMPLARAVLGASVTACLLSLWFWRRAWQAGVYGLCWLSLPLLASLQFYGGYPLRVAVGQASAWLLRGGGVNVINEGACLKYGAQLVWIDAPCSGIRMLWAGLYLACALLALWDVRGGRGRVALGATFVIIMAGNVMRAVGLFYLEAGLVKMPSWAHTGIGLVAFALTCAAIAGLFWWLRREKLWPVSASF
jgi:exosortase/archaeosortase family protein